MPEVFTPLNATRTERLRFDMKDVKVLDDKFWGWRKTGYKATVEIKGKTYKVYGASCGLPNCKCDAFIKEVA